MSIIQSWALRVTDSKRTLLYIIVGTPKCTELSSDTYRYAERFLLKGGTGSARSANVQLHPSWHCPRIPPVLETIVFFLHWTVFFLTSITGSFRHLSARWGEFFFFFFFFGFVFQRSHGSRDKKSRILTYSLFTFQVSSAVSLLCLTLCSGQH